MSHLLPRRRLGVSSLIYEVTSRCNLVCPHCYNVWKDLAPYPDSELDTADAKRLIGQVLRQTRCRQFTFTGGEPCLRQDLEELVAFAAHRKQYVNIITNGTLLDGPRIRSLAGAGATMFELPLNGPDPQTHDQMAGVTGCFDKVTRAAVDIRARGNYLVFVFVATSRNIARWKETLDLGMALGAQSFLLNRYNAGGNCHADPSLLMPSLPQLKEAFETAEQYTRAFGLGISSSIAIPPCLIDTSAYPSLGFGFCGAGTEDAYYTLDPSGNLRPCNHSPTILGNLFEHSMLELANSQTMKAFMAARPPFCSDCAVESSCQGGCKAAAEACFGDIHACEPFLAQNIHSARKVPRQ